MYTRIHEASEHRMRTRWQAQQVVQRFSGFTLIEVLAALVIVAIGMLAVIRAVNQTVSNTSYLRDKTIAHWVAMNKLTETRLNISPPANDTSEGDVDMAGATWHWRMVVTAVDPNISRIEVKVSAKGAAEDSSMDTVFGLYGKSFAPGTPAYWDFNPNAPNGNPNNGASSSSSSASSKAVPGPLT
jgi:general secretion pathway protein I